MTASLSIAKKIDSFKNVLDPSFIRISYGLVRFFFFFFFWFGLKEYQLLMGYLMPKFY